MKNLQIPIECSLPTAEAANQALEWSDLGTRLLRSDRLDDGVSLTFPAEMADSVKDLAVREAECCGFLSIATSLDGQTVRLEITSDNPDHQPVIDVLARMIGGQ